MAIAEAVQNHPRRRARAEINDNRIKKMRSIALTAAVIVMASIFMAAPIAALIVSTAGRVGQLLAGQ